ncbi:hypothetical protein CEXT_774891 [Caerostris extrusa]|uniref:Uncharacterized protein n=1 Tax=Caerostris extrusa TaxID=172846 RepID=A0AAV4S615_CAEEX|nr:hypothetical protein CEXT_774891 [Caerostris extrusa]
MGSLAMMGRKIFCPVVYQFLSLPTLRTTPEGGTLTLCHQNLEGHSEKRKVHSFLLSPVAVTCSSMD